jgi:6,7-dimethyl-8-ribityllumazine synthase
MSATEGFWPGDAPAEKEQVQDEPAVAEPLGWPQPVEEELESEAELEPEAMAVAEAVEAEKEPPVEDDEPEAAEEPAVATAVHAPGELDIPDGVNVLEGSPSGAERTVGVVVGRFNGEISNRLLESALEALAAAGVQEERITVMPVPGAFELPIGAMALAKTRRYSCVIALGCVVRGETAHFDYVAGEAASGIQLAGLETGVPVAFGVLTVETAEQAEARVDRGADAARAALEMADLFAQVREQAKSG